MTSVNFPPDYQQVMPYLIVADAEGFILFLRQVFGATERMRHMRDEAAIMHAEIAIGTSVLMLAEATPEYDACPAGLFVYVANADEAFHAALKLNAQEVTPLSDQPYGRSGGVKDPWGNTWWITQHTQG